MDVVYPPDTLQPSPVPKPHHLVFPLSALPGDPADESLFDEIFNLFSRLRGQVPYGGLDGKPRFEPDDDVGYFGCHAVGPVIA